MAARIEDRTWSSREVVDAHIAAIERVNPTLNAMVAKRFALARREADEADRRLDREGADALPTLHDVPCSIKEDFALEGMPNTSGLVARKGTIAPRDAHAVERLRRAGAIPLGVTNVSELCMWLDREGVALGVQVIAAHGRDHLCIAVAEALEEANGGWSLPSWTLS
jgi:fatty acid amide hydrolase 2